MAYRTVLRIDARCPKHIRFNPANGPGAVKAGCTGCLNMIDLYQGVIRLKRLAVALAKPKKEPVVQTPEAA